ncbi:MULTISPECIES: thiol reductant ABC exporter subunit CydC [Nocardiaceae]|uniref:ATP-binding cassette subfamily C protein CydC n=1 Tax=Rhodococcoides corynebacterioides TaxID=53972 RepID=A0ABS2KP70_9NOCA|nr:MULTISPECIES: thiol reductant ABC exporter subunit CydC [Rhodococcus]MBM7413556.1 ATP-binding cassette subfamily C protein CydC [Rhodococcus corynebacterioides]MBP1116019.1 ATP-binding cassette subfamily C protein CydC [Rhodococcus sp. PvP016]
MSDLTRALRLLDLPPGRVARAVAAGVATLGSALALSALSAWLITRAWQMPPVLHLSVAVVAVRALGITRGLCRYLERLATHDVALRGTVRARSTLYRELSQGDSATAVTTRRGDLLVRSGADVDAVGDVVVRALVPVAVAAMVSALAVGLVAVWSPAAAVVLAVALLVSGVVAPWLSVRAERAAAEDLVAARADLAAHAVTAIDHAAELRVSGRLADVRRRADEADRAVGAAQDRAAGWSALSAAATPLSMGVAVLGALAVGISAYGTGSGFAGGTDPTGLAVVVLVPLAAFEATGAIPAAAVAWVRGSAAARRIMALVDEARSGSAVTPKDDLPPSTTVRLEVCDVVAGRGGSRTAPVSLVAEPGARLAISGPSGVGKSTLAMTIAGLVAPAAGAVLVDGRSVDELSEDAMRRTVSYVAEDAHVFRTTVLENLRVVRGDVTEAEATAALDRVGLGAWVRALPDGVHTDLDGGAEVLSGGQRRRLLLARATLSRAAVIIVDEPTEHVDDQSSTALLAAMLDPDGGLFDRATTVLVVTHRPVPTGVRVATVRGERQVCSLTEKDVADRADPRVASSVHERGGGLELYDSWTREVAAR